MAPKSTAQPWPTDIPADADRGLNPVAAWREVRAEHELALEAARLEAAMGLGDPVEGDALGDPRPSGPPKRLT